MGDHTEHNWRRMTTLVESYTRVTRSGAHQRQFFMAYRQRCTRCGTVRKRGQYVGDPWLDERGREIPKLCAGK
jgi:hypothetical protein